MANVRVGNTYVIDSAYSVASDELVVRNLRVLSVTLSATSATAVLVLGDQQTTKIDLRVATSGDCKIFDFSNAPLLFNNSIRPITVTNAKATLVIDESRS